jgi:hypothetical protein
MELTALAAMELMAPAAMALMSQRQLAEVAAPLLRPSCAFVPQQAAAVEAAE